MKKLLLLIVLFLFPFMVFAKDTCDSNDIKIQSIELENYTDNIEEVSDANVEGKSIQLGFKMIEVGDEIEYKILLKNTSNKDYYLNDKIFNINSSYIKYSFVSDDNSNVIKSGKEKVVYLKIKYNKEVPDELTNNNLYNQSEVVSLKILDENPIINPLTGKGLLFYLIIIIVIIGLIYLKKKKVVMLLLLFIPFGVYAICDYQIDISTDIEIEKKLSVFNAVTDDVEDCMLKYDGKVTDELYKTVDATKVYFNRCPNKRNIIFGNMCWQMIRTTETGGIRMMYNGEVVDGKCESTRPEHVGVINGQNLVSLTLNTSYLYSEYFNYNSETGVFQLVDPVAYTWSDDTYQDILGKYTCHSLESECTTIYNVNRYSSSTKGSASSYTVGNTNYAQVGVSPYGSTIGLDALGYMYNRAYSASTIYPTTTEYLYGNSYHYDEETNTYTLTGETQVVGDWETGHDKLTNTHYTCWNLTGTCSKISYVFYTSWIGGSSPYNRADYITLSNGKTVDEILYELYEADDINKYDSLMKAFLESWYHSNLLPYQSFIEDTPYCADIEIGDKKGWDPNSPTVGYPNSLKFRYHIDHNDISCRDLFQFNTQNPKAKLRYPISLVTASEMETLLEQFTYADLFKTGSQYYVAPPFFSVGDEGKAVATSTLYYFPVSLLPLGVRPAISLKHGAFIVSGTGSEADPWVIES